MSFTARWSLARDVCSGYSKSWNIGKDDRLVLFNNCQTRSLSSRTSFLDDVTGEPKVCSYTYSKVPDVSDWSKSKVRRILNMTKTAYETQQSLQCLQGSTRCRVVHQRLVHVQRRQQRGLRGVGSGRYILATAPRSSRQPATRTGRG